MKIKICQYLNAKNLRMGNFPPLLSPSGGLSFISTMAELTLGLHALYIAQSMLLTGVSVTHILAKTKIQKKLC